MLEPELCCSEWCCCILSSACKGSSHIVQDASAAWFYFRRTENILPARRCSSSSSPHLLCVSDHIAEIKLTWRARLRLNRVRASVLRLVPDWGSPVVLAQCFRAAMSLLVKQAIKMLRGVTLKLQCTRFSHLSGWGDFQMLSGIGFYHSGSCEKNDLGVNSRSVRTLLKKRPVERQRDTGFSAWDGILGSVMKTTISC